MRDKICTHTHTQRKWQNPLGPFNWSVVIPAEQQAVAAGSGVLWVNVRQSRHRQVPGVATGEGEHRKLGTN